MRSRRSRRARRGPRGVGDEPAHVRLDRRHADLGDQLHPGDAGVERRHRRRAAVEAPRRRVRRVVGDGHREDVLVGEPAGLRREQLRAQESAHPHEAEPGGAEQVLDGATGDDVGAERARVELDRADRLVAVGEDDRAARMARARRSRSRRCGDPSGRRAPCSRRAPSARRSPRRSARPGSARPPRAGRARPRRRAAPARARSARRSGTRTR